MSEKYLGATFDVHTGGEDNIFPHHECERAQSLSATDGEFARLWVHARHLLVDGLKMSKSAGNFFTINDLLERGFRGYEIRYALIAPHYRQPMNFTIEGLEGDRKAITRLRGLVKALTERAAGGDPGAVRSDLATRLLAARESFDRHLDDDLNVSGGLGVLHETSRSLGGGDLSADDAAAGLSFLEHCDQILGVLFVEDEPTAAPTEEESALIDARGEARAAKEWQKADEIRDQLSALGILVKDGPEGMTWERKR
jgi:cysteinyl-tRNA synthetase